MPRFADVEALAVAYLNTALDARVSTDVPANLEQVLPLVRVVRGPGGDDGLTDTPLLDVECFTATRADLWDLTEQTRDALHTLAGTAVNGRLVDTVTTATGPTRLDYGNPAVHRSVASYRLALRAR